MDQRKSPADCEHRSDAQFCKSWGQWPQRSSRRNFKEEAGQINYIALVFLSSTSRMNMEDGISMSAGYLKIQETLAAPNIYSHGPVLGTPHFERPISQRLSQIIQFIFHNYKTLPWEMQYLYFQSHWVSHWIYMAEPNLEPFSGTPIPWDMHFLTLTLTLFVQKLVLLPLNSFISFDFQHTSI